MQGSTTDRTSTGYVAIHPLDPEDTAITTWVSRKHRQIEGGSAGARCHRCFPCRAATGAREFVKPIIDYLYY
jgi:hypothetical protein